MYLINLISMFNVFIEDFKSVLSDTDFDFFLRYSVPGNGLLSLCGSSWWFDRSGGYLDKAFPFQIRIISPITIFSWWNVQTMGYIFRGRAVFSILVEYIIRLFWFSGNVKFLLIGSGGLFQCSSNMCSSNVTFLIGGLKRVVFNRRFGGYLFWTFPFPVWTSSFGIMYFFDGWNFRCSDRRSQSWDFQWSNG